MYNINNPFEDNSEKLPTGFYFDNRMKCIVFHFSKQEDDLFSKSKTYNRFYIPREFLGKDSNSMDLVELTLEVLKNKSRLLADFYWISDDTKLEKAFIEFLLFEEKYLILQLFKTFKKKEANGK